MDNTNKVLLSTRFIAYKIALAIALCLAFVSCFINVTRGGSSIGSIISIIIFALLNAGIWYFDKVNPQLYYDFSNFNFYIVKAKLATELVIPAKDVCEFSELRIGFLNYHTKYKLVFKDEFNQQYVIYIYPNTTINLPLIGTDIQLRNPIAIIKL